jgi:hypothetical protein
MSRRYTSDGYDDPRDRDRRSSRVPRDPRGLRDPRDPRGMRDGRDQPLIRDPRDARDVRELRDYAIEADDEVGEMRVARSIRDPRASGESRYAVRRRDDSYGRESQDFGLGERGGTVQSPTDPRNVTARWDPQDIRRDARDTREMVYSQRAQLIGDERADPKLVDQRREGIDDRRERGGYGRLDQPSILTDPRMPPSVNNPQGLELPALSDYFLPAEGISRGVIQDEICKYLGSDATCRPYRNREVSYVRFPWEKGMN